MFATAGTVCSATREKSGSAAAAAAGAGGTICGGCAVGFCARASLTCRMRPVITSPAAKPHARRISARKSRRAFIGSGDVDAAHLGRGLGARYREHAITQVGSDVFGLDCLGKVEPAAE